MTNIGFIMNAVSHLRFCISKLKSYKRKQLTGRNFYLSAKVSDFYHVLKYRIHNLCIYSVFKKIAFSQLHNTRLHVSINAESLMRSFQISHFYNLFKSRLHYERLYKIIFWIQVKYRQLAEVELSSKTPAHRTVHIPFFFSPPLFCDSASCFSALANANSLVKKRWEKFVCHFIITRT